MKKGTTNWWGQKGDCVCAGKKEGRLHVQKEVGLV